ncbi:MAG: hypothetical protein EBT66_03205 [Bacteroidetes bacterium]|nr:hypothetical protein [Bacteroidota bacterium]
MSGWCLTAKGVESMLCATARVFPVKGHTSCPANVAVGHIDNSYQISKNSIERSNISIFNWVFTS